MRAARPGDGIGQELLFANANVITLDPALPYARSLRVRGSRIVSVSTQPDSGGTTDGSVRRIDCAGRTIVPGFIDAHGHVFAYGKRLATLDVGPPAVSSITDLQQRIRAQAASLPSGEWICARGYDEFHLREKRHPDRRDLDAASPVNPVRLTHRSGHAHVLNSNALALAGIARETEDPPDGIIDRDLDTGEPTGLLYGMHELVAHAVPRLAGVQADRAVALASNALVSRGITSVHDTSARNDLARLEAFRDWSQRGLLRNRVRMAIGWDAFAKLDAVELARLAVVDPDERVAAAGVKIIVHETTGSLSPGQKELDERIERIHRSGWQAIVHAIEPATIDAACTAIERAIARAPRADHRHRIEHCSVCPPHLARRIAAAGIGVVTHPAFVHFHGERYLHTLPADELQHLYPIATLRHCGVAVAGSSDFPVAPPDPLVGIRTAVSRRAANGETVLADESIDTIAALRLFTSEAARALRVEDTRGVLRAGAFADFVVLDGDPTRIDREVSPLAAVHATWIGGRKQERSSEDGQRRTDRYGISFEGSHVAISGNANSSPSPTNSAMRKGATPR